MTTREQREDYLRQLLQVARDEGAATGTDIIDAALDYGRSVTPEITRQELQNALLRDQAEPARAPAEPAGPGADAMRALHSRLLAAVPPDWRDQADNWIADLLDLATDDLSPGARAEVIRQALAGSQANPNAERDYEVSLGTRTVTASSPQLAAARARQEWLEETEHPGYQPDPNDAYEVRPAHSRGPWQAIYPDQPPASRQPHQPDLELG